MNIVISNPVFNFDGGAILLLGIVIIVICWIKHRK